MQEAQHGAMHKSTGTGISKQTGLQGRRSTIGGTCKGSGTVQGAAPGWQQMQQQTAATVSSQQQSASVNNKQQSAVQGQQSFQQQ